MDVMVRYCALGRPERSRLQYAQYAPRRKKCYGAGGGGREVLYAEEGNKRMKTTAARDRERERERERKREMG